MARKSNWSKWDVDSKTTVEEPKFRMNWEIKKNIIIQKDDKLRGN